MVHAYLNAIFIDSSQSKLILCSDTYCAVCFECESQLNSSKYYRSSTFCITLIVTGFSLFSIFPDSFVTVNAIVCSIANNTASTPRNIPNPNRRCQSLIAYKYDASILQRYEYEYTFLVGLGFLKI